MFEWLFGKKRQDEDDGIVLLRRISKSIEENPEDWSLHLSGDWGNEKMSMYIDPSPLSIHIKFAGQTLWIHADVFSGPYNRLIAKIRRQTDSLSAKRMVQQMIDNEKPKPTRQDKTEQMRQRIRQEMDSLPSKA